MSSINGIGSNSPVQKIVNQPIHKLLPADAAKPATTDRVELSGVSHLLKALKSNDIRVDKVAAVKAQIEAGTYEDDGKLDIAADRLLDDLLK
jgi:anti-sigma28 factor (negative regulator of flagellin synthesis)